MEKTTLVDVLREICSRGCTARVERTTARHDPHYWVFAVGPKGGLVSGIPVRPGSGTVHEIWFREFIADINDQKTWSTVGETMPKMAVAMSSERVYG